MPFPRNLARKAAKQPKAPTVVKTLIKASENTACPKPGQFVTVHYTGTLSTGQKFDSSRDRKEPFEFQVGVGQVIEGWDQEVLKMTIGERSKLIIPWQMAYGAEGMPPVIPARSNLTFDVELISVSDEQLQKHDHQHGEDCGCSH
ncbi:Peptidylprolyl isomerase [Spironucleus salmonicida]|uniref:peptidylprolyl isomerase n=1 Tax=Spironucleus salmonicida TaxID=348837 RepID=V6LJK7_9EUKA|nr:Peptidylprolyl isomerase [Spironucleus salmonicida]|eukprot:EST44775.1 FKBP-type peptidyl-prolyl cis-trans isomerase [Spironucleus salmonicida]